MYESKSFYNTIKSLSIHIHYVTILKLCLSCINKIYTFPPTFSSHYKMQFMFWLSNPGLISDTLAWFSKTF